MVRYLLTGHKRKVLAGVVTGVIVLALLVAFGVLGLVLPSRHAGGHGTTAEPRPTPSGAAGTAPGAAPGYNVLSSKERSLLDAAPDVAPATTRLLPPIRSADRGQPDLYARAFFTTLFTHSYVGVNRGQMLAWVQAQQAVSALITGGTPAELNRLLVESASDPAWSNSGYAALPDAAGWAHAAAGHTRVRIDRLTCVIPPDRETAIGHGDITDPGLTARLVSADMTATWTAAGQRQTQRFSAALTLLLEGPPTTGQYWGCRHRRHQHRARRVEVTGHVRGLLISVLACLVLLAAAPAHAGATPPNATWWQ